MEVSRGKLLHNLNVSYEWSLLAGEGICKLHKTFSWHTATFFKTGVFFLVALVKNRVGSVLANRPD